MQHLFRLLFPFLLIASVHASAQTRIGIDRTRFTLDSKPFEYTGVSFFNAIYNAEFNRSEEARRAFLAKFRRYGINVLRVWAQWDSPLGFVDTCPTCTLYVADGTLRPERLRTLHSILATSAAEGFVVELTLFSHESWGANIRLTDPDMERAVGRLAESLRPFRNVTFQIWNEFSHHTVPLARVIRKVDPERLITSSPGFAGVLQAGWEETMLMDYLTPHTSRQNSGRPWEMAPAEIAYLIAKFGKPVVDDEPARNGTSNFGGPGEVTHPEDHILQIWDVRRQGGYVTYHHDMFQTGAGSKAVPASGIPDPEFSAYHRVVFEFLGRRSRYLRR
ncbi:MAG TPA: hypothetical protein VN428_25870 [Bryobacteraceae bacterium]|nr:hypothetical protein [Bryobacteraceae bacterium]